jgi:hypothetical protein
MNWNELREHTAPALISKLEEFHLMGYNRVTETEIWECLQKKKWKKLEEPKSVSDMVNDILRLSVGDYMNYITVESYKGPNFFVN